MEKNLLSREIEQLEFKPNMEFEGPVQPDRCVQRTTLYDKPTYEQFAQSVKKWIRSCVQEGRENTLLDGNESLRAVWDYLQDLPTSMDLVNGRKVEVIPKYEWERTSGYPYWRTTKITFNIIKKKKTATLPQFNIPDPVPDPPEPPKPPQKVTPEAGTDIYYYCSKTGIKTLKVKKGTKPVPPPDAKSPFYTDLSSALAACTPTDIIPWKPVDPGPIKPPKSKDDDFDLGPLVNVFWFFGAIVFFGKTTLYAEAVFELYEIQKLVKSLFPGQDTKFHLQKDYVKNRLSILIEKNGNAQLIDKFFDDLLDQHKINDSTYQRYKTLISDLYVKMQDLDYYRSKRFLRSAGHWVRGYFIEDVYIEKMLMKQGYVGLPDWFKGFDAYKQGAKFTIRRTLGKYVTTYNNPGLISIKSYAPKGGLKNISIDYLKDSLQKEWIPKMNFKEFEKQNIRIINPADKEVHLVLVGDEDVSQFSDKVVSIKKLFKSASIVLKLLQYHSTGSFTDL